LVKPGDTVYTILRHVTRDGMGRVVDPFVVLLDSGVERVTRNGGRPVVERIGPLTAILTERKYDAKRAGVVMEGYGMDTGFELVSDVARILFGDTYALKQEWV
jgi:hypothetical protein